MGILARFLRHRSTRISLVKYHYNYTHFYTNSKLGVVSLGLPRPVIISQTVQLQIPPSTVSQRQSEEACTCSWQKLTRSKQNGP